jgi:predicted transcriptional regulator
MSLKATSVRLDEETLQRVGQMAEAMDRPMAEAIKQYAAREDWFIREVEKGIESADKGKLIDQSDIKAKWDAKRAAQMD